jgi:molybdopterin synthase sulfur carrier subunit
LLLRPWVEIFLQCYPSRSRRCHDSGNTAAPSAELARVHGEVELEIAAPVTQRSVVDALEGKYPMLRGTIRDHVTQQWRPFLLFFACERDPSLESPDTPLPDAVASGLEPLLILRAIAGG